MNAPVQIGSKTRDSELSDQTFDRIAELSHSHAGIVLSPSKKPMVKSRLTRRLRALGLSSFSEYLDFLEQSETNDELGHFISALTTNVSQFFREDHHFKLIVDEVLPQLKKLLSVGEKVRIWSAGCSNGQEAYTLAMTLLEYDPELANMDVKILATDIDPEVLVTAENGRYSEAQVNGIPDAYKTKYFSREAEGPAYIYVAKPILKNLITYKKLNLMSKWPMKGQFDLIMCRNVMIYFDEDTQVKLLTKFAKKMKSSGWLMLGHSERLPDSAVELFKSSGVTAYQLA